MNRWQRRRYDVLRLVCVCVPCLLLGQVSPLGATLQALIDEKSMEGWIKQLDSHNELSRYDAANALARMGPRAAPAIPALIRTLKSRNQLTKPYIGGSHTFGDMAPSEARNALVRIGPAAVPALTQALSHKDALTRVNAAWALWKLEKCTDKVIPVLVSAWTDKILYQTDECIRDDASQALGEIGQEQPAKVLPILLKALDEKDEEVAYAALDSLSVMGRQVKEAVAVLVKRLNDRRDNVARLAGLRLRRVGTPAVSPLVTALTDPNATVRSSAAWTLGGMEPEQVKDALPALRKAVTDPDAEVRKWASWALEMVASRSR